MSGYYILLANKVASKVGNKLCPAPERENQMPVLKGSLWMASVDGFLDNRSIADLISVDTDGAVLHSFPLRSEEIQKLSKEHFELLFAVASCEQRFAVFQDKQWLAEATHIEAGSVVYVLGLDSSTETKIPGLVRYKGSLPSHSGTWFGVELTAKFRGKGTSDGMFRKVRYFTCHMDSAVFKPVSRLSYCLNPDEFVQSPMYDAPSALMKSLPPPPPLKLGDRVVWISDSDTTEKATVKWIGVLPDDQLVRKEWMVGVEFDNRVGTGTGKYNKVQLFRTRQGYASLIPVIGLIKESEYDGMFPPAYSAPMHSPSVPSEAQTSPTLTPSESLTFPKNEAFHSPKEKYEPVRNCSFSMPHKPHSSSFISNTTELYNGEYTCKLGDSDILNENTNKKPVEATQDHLNHFNDRGNFTIDSSQPAQLLNASRDITRGASTLDRPVPSKFQQQDRYNRALGLDLPPGRPEKHITEKEAKSIYDQHPYENIEHDSEMNRMPEDIYEPVPFSGRCHDFGECDDWNDLPKSTMKGELVRQPAYNSSIDLRFQVGSCIRHKRFTMGSTNGLDTRTHPLVSYNNSKMTKEHRTLSPTETTVGANARRANYQHSNTDPSVLSPDESLTFRELSHVSKHDQLKYPDGVHTESRPKILYSLEGLIYAKIDPTKTPKARSVDDIFKGIEHGPCPRIAGNSVFYTPLLTNDEKLEETYDRLLCDESQSSATTPSSYVTAQEHLTQLGGSSLNSSTPHQHYSLCNETLDSEAFTTPDEMTHDMLLEAKQTPPIMEQPGRRRMEYQNRRCEAGGASGHASSIPQTSDFKLVSMTSEEANTDLELGSTVEVEGNAEGCRYGVIRWIGHFGNKRKPLVGLEMEIPSNLCTDGSFGKYRPFSCPPKKGFYIYLDKVKKDRRFEESPEFCHRSLSQVFGNLECDEIPGDVLLPMDPVNVTDYVGRNRGIQGHHNSCYMDATLFSMFAFCTAFDHLLKPQAGNSVNTDRVQLVLRQNIVNPLRKSFYVRADKVMNLRVVLNEISQVEGLTHAEKDPEEFLNCLLEDALKAEPFIHLSSGLHSYLYQMILEKDEKIILPSTQQLLSLSFLQANLKLTEVPNILLLQMPRCGKKYKMYPRIVPSLTIDITDIIDQVPRECAICSGLATHECRDCFKQFGDGSLLEISFCSECLERCHNNPRRADHSPVKLSTSQNITSLGNAEKGCLPVQRVKLQLSAIICIETSHYVAMVRAGSKDDSPWLFFDSMADRIGEQHGYNVPEVKICPLLAEWLWDSGSERILACKDDRDLPELVKRAICDGYICMYEYKNDT